MARRKSNVASVKYDLTNILPPQFTEKMFEGTFKTTVPIHLYKGAGCDWPFVAALPKGTEVKCEGGYRMTRNNIWLFVRCGSIYGYCFRNYLKEVKRNAE